MVVEETRSYPILGQDAFERWARSSPKGFGYVRLGPEHRAFAVSMFHQLHCLRLLRVALAGNYDSYTMGHAQHCLNYIRQYVHKIYRRISWNNQLLIFRMVLCSPNLTLEPANILARDFEVDRVGATHVCLDWSVLYGDVENNWDSWQEIKKSNWTATAAT